MSHRISVSRTTANWFGPGTKPIPTSQRRMTLTTMKMKWKSLKQPTLTTTSMSSIGTPLTTPILHHRQMRNLRLRLHPSTMRQMYLVARQTTPLQSRWTPLTSLNPNLEASRLLLESSSVPIPTARTIQQTKHHQLRRHARLENLQPDAYHIFQHPLIVTSPSLSLQHYRNISSVHHHQLTTPSLL